MSAAFMSQCTYRCVVLPDGIMNTLFIIINMSQCTYRCVVLPDVITRVVIVCLGTCLNAPTGAWCSLTP